MWRVCNLKVFGEISLLQKILFLHFVSYAVNIDKLAASEI